MTLERPVRIPKIPGKITMWNKDGQNYVRYETGRVYNAEKKYNIPKRVFIGVQIANAPELMMANENYEEYFSPDGRELATMTEEEKEEALTKEEEKTLSEMEYTERRARYKRYRAFFEELFYEIKAQSRGRLETTVPEYQAAAMNRILRPLKEMMEGEAYSEMLELIDESGMSYGDAVVLLCNYKTALSRYYSERL